MQEQEIRENFERILATVLQVPQSVIRGELRAADIEGWDSLKHVLLILEIEEFFGVRLPTSEVDKVENVGRLYDLVVRVVTGSRDGYASSLPRQ